MSAFVCEKCPRLLFRCYGDGDRLCAACEEKRREIMPPAIESKPSEPWRPVRGRLGGTDYGR